MNKIRGLAAIVYIGEVEKLAIKLNEGLEIMFKDCKGCPTMFAHMDDIRKDSNDLIDKIVMLKRVLKGDEGRA